MPKKQPEPDQTSRERILRVAGALFAEKGFAGASVREIAKTADLNISMISYYFGGKEGLYKEVLDGIFKPLLSMFQANAAMAGTARDKVVRLAGSVMSMHRKNPGPLKMLLRELISPSFYFMTIARDFAPKIIGLLSGIFSEGIAKGEMRRDINPVNAAMSFMSMLNFYFTVRPIREKVLGPEQERDESYAADALKIYFDGIAAKAKK